MTSLAIRAPASGRRLCRSSRSQPFFKRENFDDSDSSPSPSIHMAEFDAAVWDIIHKARSSMDYTWLLKDDSLKAMDDRASSWGDMSISDSEGYESPIEPDSAYPLDTVMMDIWGPEGLVEVMPSFYVTSSLTDPMFEALMNWLCHTGWEIVDQDRDLIRIFHVEHTEYRSWSWAELGGQAPHTPPLGEGKLVVTAVKPGVPRDPCRRCGTHHWISKTPCPDAGAGPASGLSKPGTDIGLRDGGAPIPRFCKLGKACPKPGCRYVHGDSIPRINMPCRFDESCCGEKRASCLHMHAGEKFVKGMVLSR